MMNFRSLLLLERLDHAAAFMFLVLNPGVPVVDE